MELKPGSENEDCRPVILVVHDVEEVRNGIEHLLETTGYKVVSARNGTDAIEKTRAQPPNLILVSLPGPGQSVIAAALRVRAGAGLSLKLPIVIFCVETIGAGTELEVADSVYLIRPDNFDQLRALLRSLIPISPVNG